MSGTNESLSCGACGGATESQQVTVTFWIGAILQVVENVPARVCARCGGRQYGAESEQRLAALVAAGAPAWKARRVVSVPVFDFADIDSFAGSMLGGTAQSAAGPAPAAGETDPVVASSSDDNTLY